MSPLSNEASTGDILVLSTTSNMKSAGISDFLLNKEFIFKFDKGGMCAVPLHRKVDTPSKVIKRIRQGLNNRLEQEHKEAAMQDIETQLLEKYIQIFATQDSSKVVTVSGSPITKKIEERINNTREEIKQKNICSEEWLVTLCEKYSTLHQLTLNTIPELWLSLECLISLYSILHIKNWTLPLMIIFLGVPSSLKTVSLDMFSDYPRTYSTDEFTPNAFVSHMSGKSEEDLQKDDMVPKMKNRLCIFPELAPVFSAKDDDLRKIVSKFLRLLDGKGYQSDSGANGHRGYSDEIMFVAAGAAAEVFHRVYKMFGNLGQKIYFLRLPRIDKSREERKENLKQKNDFKEKVRKIKEALFDYLIWLDSAPESLALPDNGGLVKFEWNAEKEDEIEQDTVLGYIVDVGELLAHLRGAVDTYESRGARTHFRSGTTNQEVNNDSVSESPLDFENDFRIIEESQRAITHLKSLAIGHAISKGRNYLTQDDIPILIKVVLSSASIGRVRIFDLLIENKGELIASDICKKLKVSPHTAHRIMTELDALEIVDMTSIAAYGNAERKIKLKDKFNWFLSSEFERLRQGFRPADYTKLKFPIKVTESNEEGQENGTKQACDSNIICDSHTNEENLLSDRDRNSFKEISINCNSNTSKSYIDENSQNIGNSSNTHNKQSNQQSTENKKENNCTTINNNQSSSDILNDQVNNFSLSKREGENCKHVTPLHCHTQTKKEEHIENSIEKNQILDQMLKAIKDARGSIVSLGDVLQSLYDKNESLRDYIGDKLTQRENRKVRQLFLEIIHQADIEVVKPRPQLLVKWILEKVNSANGGF